MKSRKLTQSNRFDILHAILAHRFAKEAAQICIAYRRLAEQLYHRKYNVHAQVAMNALGDGWLPEDTSFRVQLGGAYWEADFNYCGVRGVRGSDLPETARYRFLARDVNGNRCLLALEAGDPLTIEYECIVARHMEHDARREEASSKINAVLASVTTTARLLEVWPEIAPFLPGPPSVHNLPAPRVDELNLMLGLAREPVGVNTREVG